MDTGGILILIRPPHICVIIIVIHACIITGYVVCWSLYDITGCVICCYRQNAHGYKLCDLLKYIKRYKLCDLFMKYADWLHGMWFVVLNANFIHFYHFHPYPSPRPGKCCQYKKHRKIALCGRIALFYLYLLDFQQVYICGLKSTDQKLKNR